MKEIVRRSVTQIVGNKAKPGANLSFLKNMMFFCKDFNDKTKDKAGLLLSVEITVYSDNTFSFYVKGSPTSALLKKINIVDLEKDIKISDIIDSNVRFNTNDSEKIRKTLLGTLKSFNPTK